MHSLLATDHQAVIDLTGKGHYLEWGIIQISYANALVILLMIVVFVLALVVPFPGHSAESSISPSNSADDPDGGSVR
jgi:hypothetical protein